ncbi:hypothetical protein [Gimesia panareensis]|uniref:Uncharacterized protein n=1 Tax=Gimesia panareensis TaxID=2527978 RepID=A0A518A0G5_9PLAN|nr:hypothetical protein [Gimesia panareensis]QDT25276.1 hypothetical protein Enr10x_05710 [Gimesia panareensis]QDU48234.1 hypothetical protein Pan110_05470 [Gimesia panareensis]
MCRNRFTQILSASAAALLLSAVMLSGCGKTETTAEGPPAAPESELGTATAIPGAEASSGQPDLSQTETVSFQSGMDVGAIPMPFEVEDVTGPNKGDTLCYRCLYGERPVVGIFVRELDPKAETLIQQIDQEVASHQADKLAAFVVLLTDDPAKVKPELKKIASEKKIQHVPLTVFAGTESPLGYNVKKEAAVNVMLWEGDVKANRAFRTGELDDAGIQEVVEDTRLMVN